MGPSKRCATCGHDLSATDNPLCSECGNPRDGLRFTPSTSPRLRLLAHAFQSLRRAGKAFSASLIALLVVFLIGLVRGVVVSGPSDKGSLQSAVDTVTSTLLVTAVWVMIALAAFGFVRLWIGLARLRNSAGWDEHLRSCASQSLALSIPVTAVAGVLVALTPDWKTELAGFWFGLFGSAALLAQHLSLANLRAVCERRQGWKASMPGRVAITLLVALTLAAAIGNSPRDPLLPPLALLVAVIGLGNQLGKFAAIETHVTALADEAERPASAPSARADLSPSGRGDPS